MRLRLLGFVAMLLAATLAVPANAEDDTLVLRFVGGDTLRGRVRNVGEDGVFWHLPSGQDVHVPGDALVRIEDSAGRTLWAPESGEPWAGDRVPLEVPPAEAAPAEPAPADEVEAVLPPEPEAARRRFFGLPLAAGPAGTATLRPSLGWITDRVFSSTADWTQRVELGGRFIDGNSNEDQLNVQADFDAKTDLAETEVQLGGFLGRSGDVVNTNRWFANATTDLNQAAGDRWLLYLASRSEYDEFENLDYRGSFSAGVGYRFVNEDDRELTARIGPGVTFELFRDPYRERITGDVFAELEARRPLFDRLIFEQKTTFTPSVSEIEVFRVVGVNGLLLPLDEQERWNLKLGLRVEYNSKPNKDRLPTDYTSTLLIVYQRK